MDENLSKESLKAEVPTDFRSVQQRFLSRSCRFWSSVQSSWDSDAVVAYERISPPTGSCIPQTVSSDTTSLFEILSLSRLPCICAGVNLGVGRKVFVSGVGFRHWICGGKSDKLVAQESSEKPSSCDNIDIAAEAFYDINSSLNVEADLGVLNQWCSDEEAGGGHRHPDSGLKNANSGFRDTEAGVPSVRLEPCFDYAFSGSSSLCATGTLYAGAAISLGLVSLGFDDDPRKKISKLDHHRVRQPRSTSWMDLVNEVCSSTIDGSVTYTERSYLVPYDDVQSSETFRMRKCMVRLSEQGHVLVARVVVAVLHGTPYSGDISVKLSFSDDDDFEAKRRAAWTQHRGTPGTVSFRVIIPYCHIISLCRIVIPHHHLISSSPIIILTIIPYHHLTSSHIIISHHHLISSSPSSPSSRTVISYSHLISYHTTISYHHRLSSSYIIM